MKTARFKQKQKEYIVANGGTDNVSQIPEIRRKVIQTNLEHCGYTSNLASEETLEKKKLTYIEHYGVDNPMKNEEFVQQKH